jgi:hypothetical protein
VAAVTTPDNQEPMTPLERASWAEQHKDELDAARSQAETEQLLDDIEDYVAETDPADLPEADAQLSQWSAPNAAAAPYAWPGDGELVPVRSVGTEAEGIVIKGVLDDAGIPAVLAGTPTPYLGAIVVGQGHWGAVLVPSNQVEAATAAIEAAEIDG